MNIEPEKVVADYERNLKKGGIVSCYGVLRLLSELLEPENRPEEPETIKLRDKLYGLLTFGDRLFFGQNYAFEERKPRDVFISILQKETVMNAERLATIRKALKVLPTGEKNTEIANMKISHTLDSLATKIGK